MGIPASELTAGVDYLRNRLEFDEFTFRFNRRNSRARGLLFYRLIEQATDVPHTRTADLYQGTGRGPPRAGQS